MAWARRGGAAVHPECSGWDIVIVAPSGEQIGVQAKLRPTLDVIGQAIGGMAANQGPDIVAIAVPVHNVTLDRVARALDMTMLLGVALAPRGHVDFKQWMRLARRRVTTKRCWVPEVEIDIPCGVPSPRTVSPWKMGAAKVCARLRDGSTFTGWGRAETDAGGHYAFTTLTPGAPFFALTVFARGLLNRLFTRAYLPPAADDGFLSTVGAARRATLVAAADEHGYRFDVRLQGAGETVFLAHPATRHR